MENQSRQQTKTEEAFTKIRELEKRVSPEQEYIIGAIATYVYLVMLVSPEQLPAQIQPMIELFNNIPMGRFSLWLTTAVAFLGSVDGARRLVLDSLPFYKAYLQVFLLNKIE
ncbi:hypothetical protein KJ707_04590 [Patescibacteria group bacterium]|nr:hypothetical protein [Patescibacteria group bacterium]MBU1967111.1 hypothetical protein [Patescibacteria group bacterium]MBU2543811.1 hypothetical protein [Patescibacteria group bacterium]